jgi:hypothetical protein
VSGPNNSELGGATTDYYGVLTGFAQDGEQLITFPLGGQ